MADKFIRPRDNNGNTINPSTEDTLIELIKVLRNMQNVIPYARDINDNIRASVGGSVIIQGLQWGIYNGYPNYYNQGAPNSMDMRDMELSQSQQIFEQHRSRWSIT